MFSGDLRAKESRLPLDWMDIFYDFFESVAGAFIVSFRLVASIAVVLLLVAIYYSGLSVYNLNALISFIFQSQFAKRVCSR